MDIDSELIDNILYLKIPSFSGIKIEDIEESFLKYNKQSDGLIIDLRGNRGGNERPGNDFAEKYLLKPGTHFAGTVKSQGEGEWLKDYQIYNKGKKSNYNKPIVVLIDSEVFSSAEKFLSNLKVGADCILIGSETRGGSAFPQEFFKEIDNKTYCIKIPRWIFFLPGESSPLEETKIKPDIYYDKEDIVQYSIDYIEQINKANEEGERTKVTENVLKIAKEIDPENKLSGLDLVEEVCRYVRTMVPSQEMLNEAWKSKIISKNDKWDTNADELLSQENLIPGHSRIRNINGCTHEAYITRALLLAKDIPSLMVDTIEEEWLENNPNWKNDGIIPVSGHYFLDVYIPKERKWYTINPGNREERIHDYGDYSIGKRKYIEFAKGRDTTDMGYSNMEERLNRLEYSINI
ncbi:MAG TPA: S41 family peptidase [Pseudobacteroides sp.]|nr:S41 family peptidase [Pseudobacteroides sp.]